MRTRLLLGAAILTGLAGPARAEDDPRALIAKAIQAQGGEAKLNKLNVTRTKVRGTLEAMGQTFKFTADSAVQMPDKMRHAITMDVMGNEVTQVQVLNGGKGWLSIAGMTQDMPAPLRDGLKEELYVSRLGKLTPLLKDKALTLSALPEIQVNGRAAVGVKVVAKGHQDVSLYFDKDSMLGVKVEHRSIDPAGNGVSRETFYSDYKEIDGLKQAHKIVVNLNGKKYMEVEVVEAKFLNKLDARLFQKP
jgi:hypothetical protein